MLFLYVVNFCCFPFRHERATTNCGKFCIFCVKTAFLFRCASLLRYRFPCCTLGVRSTIATQTRYNESKNVDPFGEKPDRLLEPVVQAAAVGYACARHHSALAAPDFRAIDGHHCIRFLSARGQPHLWHAPVGCNHESLHGVCSFPSSLPGRAIH